MKARKPGARKLAMWFGATILVLSAVTLLGGCRERRGFARHEPNLYVARHGGPERVVLVEREPRPVRVMVTSREYDRGNDRRHKEEARNDRRDRKDERRTDRRDDDRRPKRR